VGPGRERGCQLFAIRHSRSSNMWDGWQIDIYRVDISCLVFRKAYVNFKGWRPNASNFVVESSKHSRSRETSGPGNLASYRNVTPDLLTTVTAIGKQKGFSFGKARVVHSGLKFWPWAIL
jgi:hypothetical protein